MYSTGFKNRLHFIKHEGDIAREAVLRYENSYKGLLDDGLKEIGLNGTVRANGSREMGKLVVTKSNRVEPPYHIVFHKFKKNSNELSEKGIKLDNLFCNVDEYLQKIAKAFESVTGEDE